MDEDEFGGFEAAEAEEEVEAQPPPQGVQASPSPWAYFPGQNQPDLIRPNVQDPLEPNFARTHAVYGDGASGGAPVNASVAGSGGNAAGLDWEPNFQQFDQASDSRSLSEQVLEPHFGNLKSDQPVPDGVLDLDLTQRQRQPPEEIEIELEEPDIQHGHAAANQNPLHQIQMDQPAAGKQEGAGPANVAAGAQVLGEQGLVDGNEAVRGVENEALQQQLGDSAAEKSRLQKEIEALVKNNSLLETEIGALRSELEEQKEQYATVEERHAADLEGMREAGQGALALIVEEYKELCKTAVLEQQTSSAEQIQQAMQRERDRWTELLKTQQEQFSQQVSEERVKLESEIKTAVEEQTQKQQEEICKLVKIEKEKLEEELQKNVQNIREENEKLVEERFQKEREKMTHHLADEKVLLSGHLEEERERSEVRMAEAVKQESVKCQECLCEAVKEERERGHEAVKEVTENCQAEIQQALLQQKQRGEIVKKKSLASIDLFLESARHQIRFLLDTTTTTDNDLGKGDNNVKGAAGCSGAGKDNAGSGEGQGREEGGGKDNAEQEKGDESS